MKKRFLALTLALAMTSALLTGCGGSSALPQAPVPLPAPAPPLRPSLPPS